MSVEQERKYIVLSNNDEYKAVAAILVMNGYTVRVKSEMVGNRKRKVLEYWSEEK